jgi:CRP/FNR family transcriptional regulator
MVYREVQNRMPSVWGRLVAGADEPAHVPAGGFVFRSGEPPRVALIHAGVVRVFVRTDVGRQLTIRYARGGDLIGLTPLLGGTQDWYAEAIVSTTFDVFTVDQVREATASHPELAWQIAEQIATWMCDAISAFADSSSQPMAARVAHHLREVALPAPGGLAVAYISQQRLADAVGTVREVISRQLRTLRAAGVIDTLPGRVVIVDEEKLEAIAGLRSPRS